MKYKLIIFDFDGTLADSFPWFVNVFNTLADTYRFKRIEAHEIESLRGHSARHMIQHLRIPWWKVPLIARRARKMATEQIGQISLFEGVDRLLPELAQAGIKMALVTSNSQENVHRVLGAELAGLISHFECGVAMFGKTPRFRRVLRQSGLLPQDALCIGDEIRDLEAAHKAGIPFGAVGWGFTQVEALKARSPEEVFGRVEDIGKLFLAGSL